MTTTSSRYAIVFAVLLDLFAVSLVVPLLPLRFKELGVSQEVNGLIGSVYSGAQIVGGVVLGYLGDRGLGRRGLLLLSFAGAATSYAVVGLPGVGLYGLVASRVVVGLFKQTMTASTAMMTELTTTGAERARWIGRISTAAQLSWIVGQSIGGYLNAVGEPWVVSTAAVISYACAAAVVLSTLPTKHSPSSEASSRQRKERRQWNVLGSSSVAAVAATRIAVTAANIATNTGRTVYELERWNLSRSDLAYFSAFKSAVGLLASWQLVGKISQMSGFWGIVIGSLVVRLLAHLVEAVPGSWWFECGETPIIEKICKDPSLLVYGALLFPLNAAATQLTSIALRSKFTDVVPPHQTAAALGALDVILAATGVAAPALGGFVFAQLPTRQQPLAAAAIQLAALIVALCAVAVVPNLDESPQSSIAADDDSRSKPVEAADSKRKDD